MHAIAMPYGDVFAWSRRLWFAWAVVINLLAAWTVAGTPTMWWTVGGLAACGVIGRALYLRDGLSRLLGLMYVPWIPVVYMQWQSRATALPGGCVAMILLLAAVTNLAGIACGLVQVVRSARGARTTG